MTAVREVKLLQQLDHPNIVRLLEIAHSRSGSIYLVFDYLPHDLSGLLHQGDSRCTRRHCQHYRVGFTSLRCIAEVMQQVFSALQYLHANSVVHRDIKASNILLDATGHVRLADFGLAKLRRSSPSSSDDDGAEDAPVDQREPFMTNRVCTIWYRAPELLLGATSYSSEVDIWSAGCVLGELLAGRALFAGRDEFGQMELITARLAVDERAAAYLNGLPWAHLCPTKPSGAADDAGPFAGVTDTDASDLLRRCLSYIPEERITAAEALGHPFFARNLPLGAAEALEIADKLPKSEWHEFEYRQHRNRIKAGRL